MKKFFSLILAAVFIFTATNICLAKSASEKRQKSTNFMISNSGVKILLFGTSHGRGLAYNNQTGETVYLKMKEIEAGLGLGAKEYDLIFLINTKAAWDSFIIGKTRFGAGADATANDGVKGGSVEGAEYVAEGVWVYQMTKKGLSLEATLKGTKIYADKELNKY